MKLFHCLNLAILRQYPKDVVPRRDMPPYPSLIFFHNFVAHLIEKHKIRMENGNIQRALTRDSPQFSHHFFFVITIRDVNRLDHETRRDNLRLVFIKFYVQRERIRFEQPQLQKTKKFKKKNVKKKKFIFYIIAMGNN